MRIPADSFSGEYKVLPQPPGKQHIIVRAVDNAGNSVESGIDIEILPIASPVISYINKDLLFQLATAYSSIGNFTRAKSLLEQIAKIKPNYPELTYWLYRDPQANFRQGVKYFDEEFYELAKKCFEAVLISNPEDKKALKYRNDCDTKITNHSS